MAIYRNVQLSFWTDNKVEDDFTPEDKYFYIYLLTNPQTNICGCYEVSYSQMTRQTGYNKETIDRLFDRFENVHRVIRYNKETKEILLINWYKYNWSKSEKTLVGVENVAKHIKSDDFRKYVFDVIHCIRNDTPIMGHICPIQASVSDTDTDTVSDTDSVADSDGEKTDKPKRKKFTIPTVEEVEAYCFERNNKVDAETFVDFYSSKGWMVGKNPMKDWKAAVRTWERKDKENQRNNGSQTRADINASKQSQLNYLLNKIREEESNGQTGC